MAALRLASPPPIIAKTFGRHFISILANVDTSKSPLKEGILGGSRIRSILEGSRMIGPIKGFVKLLLKVR
eukprot:scaffold304590_cov70-Cyclotella_meneghiniana.AAC.1